MLSSSISVVFRVHKHARQALLMSSTERNGDTTLWQSNKLNSYRTTTIAVIQGKGGTNKLVRKCLNVIHGRIKFGPLVIGIQIP